MVELIKSSEYVVMPWKNGQGVTSQIDIFPKEATFPSKDFHWRLSSARVQSSGPFSQFPGCDRYLSVLQGEGLILNETSIGPNEVFNFPGEDLIFGKLINETVIDLGIIFRRDTVQAAMISESIPAGQTRELILDYDVNYLFCTQGSFEASQHEVREHDCLKLTALKNITITANKKQNLRFFLIQVSLGVRIS